MNNTLQFLNELKQFLDSPPGTVLKGVFTSASGAIAMWFRAWRKSRKDRALQLVSDEREDRDWEMRCHRTEADLEHLDQYVERMNARVANFATVYGEIARLCSNPTPENLDSIRSKAEVMKFILSDIQVEQQAHARERPAYLERISAGSGGGINAQPSPAPSPPASPPAQPQGGA